MKKILFITFFITINNVNSQTEFMKELDKNEFNCFLKSGDFEKLNNVSFGKSDFIYYLDYKGDKFLIENKKENKYFISENFYNYLNKISIVEKRLLITPLYFEKSKLENISLYKEELINDLFNSLKINSNYSSLLSINLDNFDKKLYEYGYENCYEKLFLNIIVFTIEFASQKKILDCWSIKKSVFFNPLEYNIFYISKKGYQHPIQNYITELLLKNDDSDDSDKFKRIEEIIMFLNM